jgi:hypothetical protein
MNKKLTVICCSVLQKELETVLGGDDPDVERVFIDSMLHMDPEKLHRTMAAVMEARPDSSFLIVFGDCHPYMHDMECRPGCARAQGVNCSELLLGKEAYGRFRKEKAFLFLPEWCRRWREVFQDRLGFKDPSLAGEFMRENRGSLVYLDTGVSPVPEKTLSEISGFFGMPVTTVSITLDHLRRIVESAMDTVKGKPEDEI